jgi:putative metalloprotease
MIRVFPILLVVAYGLIMYRFSAWRTARELDARSTELVDPALKGVIDRLAKALDLPRIKVFIY